MKSLLSIGLDLLVAVLLAGLASATDHRLKDPKPDQLVLGRITEL